jgi:hypothetical protein
LFSTHPWTGLDWTGLWLEHPRVHYTVQHMQFNLVIPFGRIEIQKKSRAGRVAIDVDADARASPPVQYSGLIMVSVCMARCCVDHE